MFPHVRTVTLAALLALLASAVAQEPKEGGAPKQITNSIGMKLTLVPAGEFMMGSHEPAEDTAAFFNRFHGDDVQKAPWFKDEHPQHRVRITQPFYLGTYHVTRGQFRQFVAETGHKTPGTVGWNPETKAFESGEKYTWQEPGFEQTDEHPVVGVSWDDAVAFCKWLSGKEGEAYRLPTEAEWEYACRAGTATRYHSGDDPEGLAGVANVADGTLKAKVPACKETIKAADGHAFTSPVGSFRPNAFGLYDMHGNAHQWCADWYDENYYGASPAADPSGPDSGTLRALRGGDWYFGPNRARSAYRGRGTPDVREVNTGFRVVRKAPTTPPGTVRHPGESGGKDVTKNSIDMKMALIPAGEFMMGSHESAEETAAFFSKFYGGDRKADSFKNEHPQHRVKITRPFSLAIHPVTRGQFRQFVGETGYKTDAEKGGTPAALGWNQEKPGLESNAKYSWLNPGFEQTDDHPVVCVSWNDAVAFCKWLSDKEKKSYRLPTEAEWEYACRAGTKTRWHSGDDPETLAKVGNVADAAFKGKYPGAPYTIKAADGYVFTASVGSFQPNAFGLHDMHGNVYQWCADWHGEDYYAASPAEDPGGPDSGSQRILRGGSWAHLAIDSRSAIRNAFRPEAGAAIAGFRVAMSAGPEPPKVAGGQKQTAKPIEIKMVPVPAGEFMMGNHESTADAATFFNKLYGTTSLKPNMFRHERPLHRVKITQPFHLGAYHVTRGQFRQFVGETGYKTDAEKGDQPGAHCWNLEKLDFEFNARCSWRDPGFPQTDEHPVVCVSWNDAVAFCKWLSGKEGKTYRLPTEAEWEYACRAGATTRYYSGDDPETLAKVGNTRDATFQGRFPGVAFAGKAADEYVFTAPAGSFQPNALGLHDMHGNASQWCADWYGAAYYAASPAADPAGPDSGAMRVCRGGSWMEGSCNVRSASRDGAVPSVRKNSLGFRVAMSARPEPSKEAGGERRGTKPMELKFSLVPAGEFLMGSGESAEDSATFFNKFHGTTAFKADLFKDERPQHRVRITRPFQVAVYPVTRGQFRQFVDETGYKTDVEKGQTPGARGWNAEKKDLDFNARYSWRDPGFPQTDEHPVVCVSWNDAVAFCKWLSGKDGKTYRLPTEAEWEYACRAGTTTRYYGGDDPETLAKVGNVPDAAFEEMFPKEIYTTNTDDGYVFTAPVGSFRPNAFGLFDMHGNASQWCADWYGAEYYGKSPSADPAGPDSGVHRVVRGGNWGAGTNTAQSSGRYGCLPSDRNSKVGFRVVRNE